MRWFDVAVARRDSPRPKKPWWSRALFWGLVVGPWPYLLLVMTSHIRGHGHVVAALLVALVSAWWRFPRLREAIKGLWRSGWVRRKWMMGSSVCGLMTAEGFIPMIVRFKRIPAGDQLVVRLPRGGCVSDLEKAAERMAAVLEVKEMRVDRHPTNARFADVTLIRRDPLAHWEPIVWPYAEALRCSLWERIPVGVYESGHSAWLSLPERNVLIGGEPGAGKSVSQSLLVAAAALDPEVRLVLLDGKLVELAPWAPCAEHSVGVDVAEAVEVLNQLRAEMDDRYRQLLAAGKRKVTRHDGMPLWMVVVDELAHYTMCDLKPDKGARKLGDQFSDALRDLVSRGRAAGVIVVAATQKPSHEIVPTALRDLFGFRWALRCSTPQASDTILGAGWASNGYTASDIDPAARGVGLLLQEGGIPTRIRSYFFDDETVKAIVERALRVKSGQHHLTVLGGGGG